MTAADECHRAFRVDLGPAGTGAVPTGCGARANGKPGRVGREVHPARGVVYGLALRAREP